MSGGSGPKAPPPPPPPPQKTDAEIQAEAAKQNAANRKRIGRGSTILAGESSFLAPTDSGQKTTLG